MASHRYWRIFCHQSAPLNSYATFAEIEFRESLGGANVATAGNGTISADSFFSLGHVAANAIDGNASTMWESGATAQPHWWQIYFDVARDVQEITIKANASWPDETPRVFDVQWSDDGKSWITRFAISDAATAWTAGQQRVFNAGSSTATTPYSYPASAVTYWRIYATKGQNGGYLALSTVAMKESAGGANVSVAANGTATADSQYDGTSSPDKAADGNSSTHWESGGSFPHWWAFAFSSPRLITEISLSNATAWPNEAPRTTLVQHSADGVTWLTAWMIDDPNLPWANPETRTYTYADDTAAITGTGASTLDDATSAGTGTAMGRTEAKPTGTLTAIKSGQYSSLAVLYAFNELTGTVANLATPADSLVITGGTRSADSVGRYFDPGDGIGDNALSSLTVGDLGISAAGPWSFFCRLAPPGFSDGTDRTIMSIGNGNSGGVEFNVYGTIYEWFSGDWRSGIDRPATEIQTFVVTYDGSVVRVYANGTAGAATTLTFGFPTGSKIAIGIDQRAAFNYFNDRIYEAGFVTACWTLAEVKAYDASPLAMVSSAAAITGTGAGTLDDATSGAAGTHTITGTASSSLDELAGAATGTFTPAAITGTASPTLEDLAGAAIGTHTITGTASPTLEDLASAGAGAQTATGTASTSLDDLTSAAIGGFTPAAITGTAASTLEDLASAGTDNEGVFGTASSTLDELTGAGWETTVAGGAEHSLAALTSQATGGTFLAGAGGAILFLADLTSEAAGGHTIGAGAGILAALDGAASGFIEVSGTASSILGDAGSHGFGTAYMARRVRSVTMTGSLKAPKVLNGTMRI